MKPSDVLNEAWADLGANMKRVAASSPGHSGSDISDSVKRGAGKFLKKAGKKISGLFENDTVATLAAGYSVKKFLNREK